jgi:hypothetical protein
MIAAFDVDTDDPYFSRKFYRAALDREALIRPIGNTVYLMPPYVVSDDEIAHLGPIRFGKRPISGYVMRSQRALMRFAFLGESKS